MYVEDIPLLINFHTTAGHTRNSIKTYKTAFNKYRKFHKMSLTQLLKEALAEQEQKVPENQLKVYDRINSFKQYLIENHVGNTITTTIPKIKTFYRYNRIKLPYFPPINTKTIKQNNFISYNDLLSKEEILKGLRLADDYLKNWIMIMICSGSTRQECKQMTNRMLFEGTYKYHQKDSLIDAFKYLSLHDNVVCTCKLIRQKTQKPYYTFLNPETVQQIAKSKLQESDIGLDERLLKYSEDYIGRKCKYINDYLNLGYAGGYSRFRPHMFRKWHATRLNQGLVKNLDVDDIDQLQGRGKNSTRDAYYKNNPEKLKIDYIETMNNISLYNSYSYEVIDGEIKIKTKYL